MVVLPLPREAVIKWHVIAAANEPSRRKHSTLKRLSEGFQVEREAVAPSLVSRTPMSISLKWTPPSISLPDLNRILGDPMTVFPQARRL